MQERSFSVILPININIAFPCQPIYDILTKRSWYLKRPKFLFASTNVYRIQQRSINPHVSNLSIFIFDPAPWRSSECHYRYSYRVLFLHCVSWRRYQLHGLLIAPSWRTVKQDSMHNVSADIWYVSRCSLWRKRAAQTVIRRQKEIICAATASLGWSLASRQWGTMTLSLDNGSYCIYCAARCLLVKPVTAGACFSSDSYHIHEGQLQASRWLISIPVTHYEQPSTLLLRHWQHIGSSSLHVERKQNNGRACATTQCFICFAHHAALNRLYAPLRTVVIYFCAVSPSVPRAMLLG